MPDYECFPLWESGKQNIDPKDLPLSSETVQRLIKWAENYDETLNHDYPPDSGFKSDEERMKFNKEGRELLEKLKSELGSNFDVLYFNNWDK